MGIGGSEWIIIALISMFLIFGSKKIPEISRQIGKAVWEYNKSKEQVMTQINRASQQNVEKKLFFDKIINEPVASEREKLEKISKSLDIDIVDKTDEELRNRILKKMKKDNF